LKKIRTIVAYKDYFEEFLVKQPFKVQNEIYKIFEIIEYQQHIPTRYIEHITGTEGRLVILLNGFQKKTQKTPKTEISIALRLKDEYFEEKGKGKI
jgi:phage-related protein